MVADALSSALAIAFTILLALSSVVLFIAILLPAGQRKKLLHRRGRKWVIQPQGLKPNTWSGA